MDVVYVAKHDGGGNDDEGAITHALTALGHTVRRLREVAGRSVVRLEGDFLLFHKWHDVGALCSWRGPKVFWYFDLVEYPDPALEGRNAARRQWMTDVLPHVDLGFCTDGDWVDKCNSGDPAYSPTILGKTWGGKCVWLTQGADARTLGPGNPTRFPPVDLLFTGTAAGGRGRSSWVAEMKERYGGRFLHVPRGLHGRELADRIASAKIVLAPDHPVTDRYFSNRVFNTLGFGAFLLHPWSEGAVRHYEPGKEVVYYRSRRELHDWVADFVQDHPGRVKQRQEIAAAGYERTRREHTYVDRVETLVRTVKERLGI
jgi:hypothetical protein